MAVLVHGVQDDTVLTIGQCGDGNHAHNLRQEQEVDVAVTPVVAFQNHGYLFTTFLEQNSPEMTSGQGRFGIIF